MLTDALLNAAKHGGSYHFLRIKNIGGEKRAVFRLLMPGTGVNYHEFVLAGNEHDEIHAIDIYIYIAGEMLSETLHTAMIQALADPGLIAKLTGQDNAFMQSRPTIVKMQAALAAKEFQKVIDLYRELPEEMQHSNSVMGMRLQAAARLGEAESTAAFEDYRKFLPNNAAVDLWAVDYHLNRKEYAAERKAIGRVSKRLGGDAYQTFLIGSSYFTEGKLDEAAKAVQRAIDDEPTLKEAYFARINIALKQKDFPAVRVALEGVEANTPTRMSVQKIQELPTYAEFAKSDDFKQWVAHRPAAKPQPAKSATEKSTDAARE